MRENTVNCDIIFLIGFALGSRHLSPLLSLPFNFYYILEQFMPTAIELPSSEEPSNKEDAMAERARIIEERNALQLKVSVLSSLSLFDAPFFLT
jgi:hypothetical protein